VVAHLAEVEERRLHLKAAASSLFDYCLRRLGFSESEAFHRITAARLARRFPMIFELLAARSIHLSALRILRDHLTPENHRELLAAASGKSKREVELLVAAFAPRPDVPTQVRKLPVRRAALRIACEGDRDSSSPLAHDISCGSKAIHSPPFTGELPPDTTQSVAPHFADPVLVGSVVASSAEKAPSSEAAESSPDPRLVFEEEGERMESAAQRRGSTRAQAFEPLSSTRYLLRMSVSSEFKDKLERARDLMSHRNPSGELAQILESALDFLVEKLERQRFAQTKRPHFAGKRPMKPAVVAQHEGTPRPQWAENEEARLRRGKSARVASAARRQHIPNEVRRAVAKRDGEQCTYVDLEGRRCSSRAFLQLHHEHAHALGGPSTLENLRLLCGAHNRLLAEQDFGRVHQDHCVAARRRS
jgi:5-methylcytosine-specific restriction endonuclease McrA